MKRKFQAYENCSQIAIDTQIKDTKNTSVFWLSIVAIYRVFSRPNNLHLIRTFVRLYGNTYKPYTSWHMHTNRPKS